MDSNPHVHSYPGCLPHPAAKEYYNVRTKVRLSSFPLWTPILMSTAIPVASRTPLPNNILMWERKCFCRHWVFSALNDEGLRPWKSLLPRNYTGRRRLEEWIRQRLAPFYDLPHSLNLSKSLFWPNSLWYFYFAYVQRGRFRQFYPHCKEISIYVFPERELRGISPNFHISWSVSDLYIPTFGPAIFLEQNRQTSQRIHKAVTET